MPPGHRHGVKAGVIVRGTGIQNVNVRSQMSLLKGRLNVGRLLTLLLVLVLAGAWMYRRNRMAQQAGEGLLAA